MRASLLLAVFVACGPAPTATTTTTTGGATTIAQDPDAAVKPAADAVWTWSAGIVPSWRVDGVISDILPLDDKRALAIASAKLHLVTFDGIVTTKGAFEQGSPSMLVFAGGRALAYGNATGKTTAVWSIDPATLDITRLELPEPAPEDATKGRFQIAVSPDGKRVVTCGDDRWPTVRDAVTLAPVATFKGVVGCNGPRFVDDARVVLDRHAAGGGRVGEIASGKVTTLKSGTPIPWPGPGGQSATVVSRKVTITAGGKPVTSYDLATNLPTPQWLGDGTAIASANKGTMTLLAAKVGGTERTFEIPAPFRRWVPIPGTQRVLFQAGPHRLGVLDIPSGKALTAEGANLDDVAKVAVIDGAVVSGAERVRVWRNRANTAGGPLAVAESIDVDEGRPALYATLDGVYLFELATGKVEAIDSEASSTAADRHGGRILFDADDYVKSRQAGGDAKWFRRSSDFFITDLDAANGRVAMTDDDAFYVAWPDEDELFGFHAFDCEDPLYLYLERGQERAAAYDGVTVHLYDTEKKTALGGIELTDDNIDALAFIPGSDELALVGESIYLWDPVRQAVVAWPLPAEHGGIGTTAIALDPKGAELAVGFSDGSVLWATLAGVRAHARPVGSDVFTGKSPASLRCKGKKMAASISDVRVAEEPDDVEGDEAEDHD